MPSVRMAITRPAKVEVDVEAMVAFMSEVGTDRPIDAVLAFCRKCLGADFVSILPIRGPAFRRLSERRRPRPPTMRAKRRWATCSTLQVTSISR